MFFRAFSGMRLMRARLFSPLTQRFLAEHPSKLIYILSLSSACFVSSCSTYHFPASHQISPLPFQDLLSYLVSVDTVHHGRTFKQAESHDSRIDRMSLCFHLFSYLKKKRNIGNARIAGLTTSLHMSSKQFSIALTIT